MKKILNIGLLSLGILAVSGCATINKNCQPTDRIYMTNYQIALDNGNSPKAANTVAKASCRAYNVGKWANSEGIAKAKSDIDTVAINNANTAQEQQAMLDANRAKLEAQRKNGDIFSH